jgi:subtilisin family serine protease
MFRLLLQGIWGLLLTTLAAQSAAGASFRVESFTFKEPVPRFHRLLVPVDAAGRVVPAAWLGVDPTSDGALPEQEFGARIVLRLSTGTDPADLPLGENVRVGRRVDTNLWVLETDDAHTAAREAASLATLEAVRLCHPDFRFQRRTSSTCAPRPNDEKYLNLWHLESRDADGAITGASVNAREAWAISRGEGIVIAVGDNGLEVDHPDLAAATAGQPHFNFENQGTNVIHTRTWEHHRRPGRQPHRHGRRRADGVPCRMEDAQRLLAVGLRNVPIRIQPRARAEPQLELRAQTTGGHTGN